MDVFPDNRLAVDVQTPVMIPGVTEVPAQQRSEPQTAKAEPLYVVSCTKRKFLICSVVASLILLGYNLVIHRIARSSQRQQLMAALERIPADTDCLFIGNSLVEAGLDAGAFQEGWPRGTIHSRNIALGATYPTEHYLILKKALSGKVKPKYIIYGFFDDELNVPASGKWEELVGNRALSYYFPDDAADIYKPGSTLKKWELRVASRVPMFSERSSLWGKVDVLREEFGGVGMPHRERNRFGFVQNFSALEASGIEDFNRRCNAAANGGFSVPVEKIIQLAQEHGATLVLVEMPMPSRHRQTFYSTEAWSRLQRRLQSLAFEKHLRYISASDWVGNDAEFEDVTHLNEVGAKDFSAQLAKAIAELK
jgi:hypothetical protein